MKKKILTLLTLLLALSACSSKNEDPEYGRYSNTSITSGFDTTMTLLAYTESEEAFNTYFEMLKDTFWEYHIQFDIYNKYEGINNLKTINDNAGIEPVKVDDVIIQLLLEAKKYTEISDYFDITFGAVFKVWHNYREKGIELNSQGELGPVPTIEELEAAAQYVGWEYVEINEDNNTVFITKEGVSLDVGAIAKGYATEMVARKLEAAGLKYAIVSGGGNIRTIGKKVDQPWLIGIQEPSLAVDTPSVEVFSLETSTSVVTSGDYQRTYTGTDNITYSHLINPNTLFPETHFRSVSVITENSTLADILSTSLFMMNYEEGQKFVEDYNNKYPENKIDVVWIVDDNPDWYQKGDFDYMVTDDLIEISKYINEGSN